MGEPVQIGPSYSGDVWLLTAGGPAGLGGLGTVFAPVPLWVVAFLTRTNVLRCHERGVWHRTKTGAREVAFADPVGFTWAAERRSPSRPAVRMRFDPPDGPPIECAATVPATDAELDRPRGRVGRVVAAGMLDRLKSGRPVALGRRRVPPRRAGSAGRAAALCSSPTQRSAGRT